MERHGFDEAELTLLVATAEDLHRDLRVAPVWISEVDRRVAAAFITAEPERLEELEQALILGLHFAGVVVDLDRGVVRRQPYELIPDYVPPHERDPSIFPPPLAVEIVAVEAAMELSHELDEDDDWCGLTIEAVGRKLVHFAPAAVPVVVAAVLHGLAHTGLVVLDTHLKPLPDQTGALDQLLADWLASGEVPDLDGPWLRRIARSDPPAQPALESQYRFVLASEVGDRDGMLVELHRREPLEQIAEVFEDHDTGALTFTADRCQAVPLPVIEELLQRARREFPSPHLRGTNGSSVLVPDDHLVVRARRIPVLHDGPALGVELTHDSTALLLRCLDHALEIVDGEEFQSRTGYTRGAARTLRDQLTGILHTATRERLG